MEAVAASTRNRRIQENMWTQLGEAENGADLEDYNARQLMDCKGMKQVSLSAGFIYNHDKNYVIFTGNYYYG